MKLKFHLLSLLLGTAALTAQADDLTLFSCDFQTLEQSKSDLTTYELSGNTPTRLMQSIGYKQGTGWLFFMKDTNVSSNAYAACTSQFAPAGTANAWMITKAITLPGKGCKLAWKSESYDPQALDGLKVFVSTQGGNPATDFPATPIWESAAESAGASEALDGEWNEHSVSLEEYAGQTVWIAFVNQTYDGSLLCVDDILVTMAAPMNMANHLPPYITGSTLLKGELQAITQPIEGGSITYRFANGFTTTLDLTGVNLQPGESYAYTMPKPLQLADKHTFVDYTYTYEKDGEAQMTFSSSVALTNFVPRHRAVVEEGTGSWCGWCPLGILAIEYLQESYPDNFLAIGVHNDDPLTVAHYDEGLAFPNFPMGIVNRRFTAYPMRQDTEDKHYYLDGSGTFLNGVQTALAEPANGEPHLLSAVFENGEIAVKGQVRFAMPPQSGDYRVAYVLLEDSVLSTGFYQANYLASYTLPEFGRFGAGGECGSKYLNNFIYMDVARGIYPSFKGQQNVIPAAPEVDTPYDCALSINLSATQTTIANAYHLRLAMLLLDGTSGQILNADVCPVDATASGIHSTLADAQAAIRLLPGGALSLPADTQRVEVFTTSGIRCTTNASLSGLPAGTYVVRCTTPTGTCTAVVAYCGR